MKKILISIIAFAALGCNADFQYVNSLNRNGINTFAKKKSKDSITGDIRTHLLKTKFLKSGKRELVVYLPPSYKKNSEKNFPVLYMHDGQNIFDKATGAFGKEWYVDEKTEYLIKKNVIEEVIIVGIYNGLQDRLDEYTWSPMNGYGGGEGRKYGEFLVNEVKPFIDNNYRTLKDRTNTAVAGSSLGGLISFYLASNYSPVFSKVAMLSPSIWWNNGAIISDTEKISGNFTFWLDAGTKESETMVDYVNRFAKKLEHKIGNKNLFKFIHKDAEHNEEAWAVRIHAPLIQFFGKEKDPEKKRALIERLMVYEEWEKL